MNLHTEIQPTTPDIVRVFSPRLGDYIEVSLSAENPDEDQLGGVMPVMLVTDHPLSH